MSHSLTHLLPVRRSWLVALMCAAATVGLAACGGDDKSSSDSSSSAPASTSSSTPDSGSSGTAEAQAAVEKSSAAPKFKAPGPAFDVKPGLKGKTIWYVANGLNFPFSQNLVRGVTDGAAVAGMKVNAVDGNGQPAKGASLIEQGISQKAGAIVIQAFPTDALVEPIKAAKAAGIPVIQINDGDPGLPSQSAQDAGVVANVSSCYACGGTSLADLVVANTDGKANVVFIDVPDIKTTLAERDAFKARLSELCADCKVKVVSSPVGQWGGLGNLTSSTLKSDPSINYLVPALDAMASIMKPAIFAANAQDRIQLSAYNATQPVMANLKKGELVGGLVGNPEEWMGWAVVDETLRALSGESPVENENVPNRTFTQDSVQDLNLGARSITWYGDPGFEAGYKDLWKLP